MLGIRRRGFTTSLAPSAAALAYAGRSGTVFDTSSGAVDGQSLNLTGPSGSTPTVQEWLGGSGGVIDSGTLNAIFTRTNWTRGFPGEGDWRWNNTRVLSRNRSLVFDPEGLNGSSTNGRGTYYFDHGAAGYTQEYFSCNYYWEMTNPCQWKLRRAHYLQDVVDTQDPSWYTSCNTQSGFRIFVNVYNQHSPSFNQAATSTFWPNDQWFRFESFFTVNSPAGTANGSLRIKVTRISTGAIVYDHTFTNINFRGNSPAVSPFRFLPMQNYIGNSTISGRDHGGCKIFMDDIYIASVSSGTGAYTRAELIDTPTITPTSRRAICGGITVSGTNWTIPINRSHHSGVAGNYVAMFGPTDTDATATIYGPLT